MPAGHLIDLGSVIDLHAARTEAAQVAVEELWVAVPDGRDRFDVPGLLAMRERVAHELGGRVGSTGVTFTAITRLLEEAGVADEALALSVDGVFRDVRDRVATPVPGAVEALGDLVARVRVALVGVGTIDWRRFGIEVDTVLLPGALGLHRGDPELVRRAADRLGVAVDDLVVKAPTGSPLLEAAERAGAVPVATGSGGLGAEGILPSIG